MALKDYITHKIYSRENTAGFKKKQKKLIFILKSQNFNKFLTNHKIL